MRNLVMPAMSVDIGRPLIGSDTRDASNMPSARPIMAPVNALTGALRTANSRSIATSPTEIPIPTPKNCWFANCGIPENIRCPVSAAANLPTLQEISGMTVGETWDSWLEMNPEATRDLGLKDRDLVWVESPFGKVKTKVRLVKGLRPDVVNLPYNQGHTAVGRWAKGRGVNGMELLNPASEPAAGSPSGPASSPDLTDRRAVARRG